MVGTGWIMTTNGSDNMAAWPDDNEQPERIYAYWCSNDDILYVRFGDGDGGSLYYCEADDTSFNAETSADGNSHRCPTCSRFAKKVSEHSCAGCGAEVGDPCWVIECDTCCELIPVEEWEEHREECFADDDSDASNHAANSDDEAAEH